MAGRRVRQLVLHVFLAASALTVPATGALAQQSAGEARAEREAMPESLRGWIRELPRGERRAAVRRLRRMDPEGREAFVRRFESMSDAERARLRARLGRAADAAPGRLERNRRAWSEMDASQRERMRDRLRRFQSLEPAQQEALVERRFEERSAAEREQILERLRGGARPGG